MKTLAILITLLAVLVCAAPVQAENLAPFLPSLHANQAAVVQQIPEPNPTVINMLSGMGAHLCVIQSLRSGGPTGGALVVNFPVKQLGTFNGHPININADVLGVVNEGTRFGVGGSITVDHLVGPINLGLGWAPGDFGPSVYVGIVKVFGA